MKCVSLFLIITVILSGCRHELSYLTPELTYQISYCPEFNTVNSRSTSEWYFQEEDQILLYSQGGITADKAILTYQNQQWNSTPVLKWEGQTETASIQAYYPITAETGTSAAFYPTDNKLIDLLGCQTHATCNEPIELLFEHQFSQLTFRLDPALNKTLVSMEITPSVSVRHFDFITGTPSFDTGQTYTTLLERTDNPVYTLVIPPAENMSIRITLTTTSQYYQLDIDNRTYKKGYSYECAIRPDKRIPGIYNAEDFIAFTHLISGIEYGNRKLEEFADNTGNVTTYNLYNDITFTPEECERIHEIGYYREFKSQQFNDCFNGNGYTLSNLILQAPQKTYGYGLFSFIGTSGIVKDLTIKDSQLTTSQYSVDVTGLLSGANYGLIDGCQLINCTITSDYPTDLRVGGIAGSNKGIIANTSVTYTSIINTSKQYESASGSICSNNFGYIQNCYAACNTFSEIAGGLTYTCEKGSSMSNCYTYGNTPSPKFGNISYRTRTSNISYCYYDDKTEAAINASDYTHKNLYYYNPTILITTDNQRLTDKLNGWITGHTPVQSTYSYHQWIPADDYPLTLKHP